VAFLTIVSIWLFGLGKHRSIFSNSLLSTTILSTGFFLFLAIGLYKGIKLKDNLGRITHKGKSQEPVDLSNLHNTSSLLEVGDSIGGFVISIILWLLVTVLIGFFIWFFGVVFWTAITVFVAMLYWIFFRAVRLVFKNSYKCKGKFILSVSYGLLYTLLYNFWIYGIILGVHYLVK
jgi:hypothetical protein